MQGHGGSAIITPLSPLSCDFLISEMEIALHSFEPQLEKHLYSVGEVLDLNGNPGHYFYHRIVRCITEIEAVCPQGFSCREFKTNRCREFRGVSVGRKGV